MCSWNGSWNEIVTIGGTPGIDEPVIAGNAGNGGHDVPLNRPPEAGAQVRILPGAPRKSGIFGKLPADIPIDLPDWCRRFHCTFHCTQDRGSDPFGVHGG